MESGEEQYLAHAEVSAGNHYNWQPLVPKRPRKKPWYMCDRDPLGYSLPYPHSFARGHPLVLMKLTQQIANRGPSFLILLLDLNRGTQIRCMGHESYK